MPIGGRDRQAAKAFGDVYSDAMRRLFATAFLLAFPVAIGAQAPDAAVPQPASASPPRNERQSLSAGSQPSAEANRPLPDPVALMREVEANEKTAERLVKNYTFRSTSVLEQTDGKGGVKKTETEEREFFVREGVPVSRLLKKDGRALTPDEERKEDDHIRKEVEKAKTRKEKAADKGKEVDARGDDEITLSRILELGTFSNERRAIESGRSTILLDYTGNKDAKAHNPAENVFKDLAGSISIDEATRGLTHMDGQFRSDFKVGGGLLASVTKGTHFSFSAVRINDEIWLPREAAGEGSARFLLLLHFNGRMRVKFSDYQKFRASGTVLPGITEVPKEP